MKELNALSYGKRSYEAEDKHMESKRFKGKNHQPFNSAIVCYQCKCPGHKASECKKRNNTSSGSFPRHEKPSFSMGKPRGVCYTCQSTEHYANSCPQRKDGRRGPAGQRPQGRINEKRVELCLVNPSGSLNHKDDDDDESTRSRRFSPIQWLMHACCQIATTDDTDELFNTQSRLSNQVESMRMDIHMDHQAVAASVASIDDITKQFNVIADTTKHALASSLLNEEKLEQRESPLLKPIINLFGRHYRWLEDDLHCQPELNSLCFIPRDIFANTPDDGSCPQCPTTCINSTNTVIASKGGDTFVITHPPNRMQVSCANKSTEIIKLPEVKHVHLEVKLPCECMAILEFRIIEASFPCEAQWTDKLLISHVLPNDWVPQSETITSVLLNGTSIDYKSKIAAKSKGEPQFWIYNCRKQFKELICYYNTFWHSKRYEWGRTKADIILQKHPTRPYNNYHNSNNFNKGGTPFPRNPNFQQNRPKPPAPTPMSGVQSIKQHLEFEQPESSPYDYQHPEEHYEDESYEQQEEEYHSDDQNFQSKPPDNVKD
ncbi:hypothetical protein M8J77_014961 [Diaphorina citri]|nr:hypothetical protein M8J77_014961 [Diaphorina citri]